MQVQHLINHQHLVAEIAALLNQEWGQLSPWSSLSEIENRLSGQLNIGQSPFTLVALGNYGIFLGTASVKLFELPEHRDKMHWLGEVFVPTELRGQGIGSILIRACISESRRIRVPTLYLYTPDQQALYARLGWEEHERAAVNGEDVSIMRLILQHGTAQQTAETDPA
jgi:predicted N-acetyltransferase YhbS